MKTNFPHKLTNNNLNKNKMNSIEAQIIATAINIYSEYKYIPQMVEHISKSIPEADINTIKLIINTVDAVVDKCFDSDMNYNSKLG